MDTEYDCKFEEMKKYIPFLENMITRLESTSSTSSNPRQAQLDKIRSLRDLLSNKKKRMKMENLLKCEQVLVNLYAKVEQRDTISSVKKTTDSGFSIDTPTPKEKSDLEAVRNKLKTVAKRQENIQDTLPEILPRSEINDVHTSGTKEPALFQRRPNQQPNQTSSDIDESLTSPQSSNLKRNYTRVLVSPERRWSPTKPPIEKPLFSRRSPRKSPRRYSPSCYKKEKKKSRDSQKRKDLNITLNVPEESLNSLNTKDILSRIINCSDGDVDIDTLRELRKQILGELQKTGAKDDISDLILKSYNKSKNKKNKNKPKLKEEVEEGELSDSESEAIESIYGSLVVKEPGQSKKLSDKDNKPRKIQICLVINSDDKPNELPKPDISTEFAELEMYEKENKEEKKTDSVKENNKPDETKASTDKTKNEENCDLESKENVTKNLKNNATLDATENAYAEDITASTKDKVISPNENKNTLKESIQFKANFYKPLKEQYNAETADSVKDKEVSAQSGNDGARTANNAELSEIESTLEQMEKSPEIPLLHERTIEKKPPDSTLSEIDILQALKNEILSEITMPGTEAATPLLHQPKVIKVASAQEILPKKRISIEKYKEKSVASAQSHSDQKSLKDDQLKKPSLKLTDKECERFFNIPKIPFGDEEESVDEDGSDILGSDVYGDLAPKSPDHDESSNLESAPPVIIPADPVKTVPVIQKVDVDMRTLPLLSPSSTKAPSVYNNTVSSTKNELSVDKMENDNRIDQINVQNRPILIDPRVRRDLNTNISNQSPNPHAGNSERIPRHSMFAGIPSNATTPVITTNARTYEMTPTHQSFEIDQSSQKHVYIPTITGFDYRDREKSVTNEGRSWENVDSGVDRRSRVDDLRESCWNPSQRDNPSQNTRYNDSCNTGKYSSISKSDRYHVDRREDLYQRSETPVTSTPSLSNQCQASITTLQTFGRPDCPSTSSHPFGGLECPSTPSHPFGRLECPPTPSHPFGRLECPPTPSHPFGRLECPPTPSHPFGRLECPPTPSHPFGRLECPPTPSHPFGRTDCPPTSNLPFGRIDSPSTPSHPFGRLDCPPTPSHPFGRPDCPPTPSHPFGRTEGPLPLMLNLIECPPTPSSQFGGADCPPTPTPLFGRNECPPNTTLVYTNSECTPMQNQNQFNFIESPQTPGVVFGRSDPTKSNYGRPDFNQKHTKDPRLNRKPESDSKSQYDQRDRGYYKDRDRFRGSSYSSQKPFSDREQSVGRSKYKYFSPELLSRQYKKDQEKYDRSLDRSMSRDRDRRYNAEAMSYEEVGSRRDNQSDKNFAQNKQTTSSVNKRSSREPERNKLSVKSNAGRSFTIDTSINTTFQATKHSVKDIQDLTNNFDTRRQRAASVGRFLIRESSIGRTLSQESKSNSNLKDNKREAFRRAASVGRDFDLGADKRSFQEIKADFRSCKFPTKRFSYKKSEPRTVFKSMESLDHSRRSRKDFHEREKTEKRGYDFSKSYSPRKNYRDPRMRRQFENKYDRHGYEARSHKSGIVYSNDNIVTGSILTSGYGVKNYKIPKIKRATEEKEDKNVEIVDIDSKKDKKNDDIKINEKGLEKRKVTVKEHQELKEPIKHTTEQNDPEFGAIATEHKELCKEVSKSNENVERRQTRSSKKGIIESKPDTESIAKSKKNKMVIQDSDSDNENDIRDKGINTKDASLTRSDKSINHTSPLKIKKRSKKLDPADLDSNFGIDELEMFSDNVVSDPVIDDNINALIADLDDDLSTSKTDSSHHFTKEITLENMMQNISSPEKDRSNPVEDDTDKLLEAIDNIANDKVDVPLEDKTKDNYIQNKVRASLSPVSKDNISDVVVGLKDVLDLNTNDKQGACLKDIIGNTPTQSDAVHSEYNTSSGDLPSTSAAKNNTDIDSTTEVENEDKLAEDLSNLDERNTDGCSTPDSTINTDEASQKTTNDETLAGSTNEVSSTESIESKPSSSAKELHPALDSIGSLLSILQDKSKIKELLNMLGDHSGENEKIKKKLEKLSEIVSDDEEICDVSNVKTNEAEKSAIVSPDVTITKNLNSDQTIGENQPKAIGDEQFSKDSSNVLHENKSKLEDDDTKTSDIEGDMQESDLELQNDEIKPKKKYVKKTKGIKKAKGKLKKVTSIAEKRVTRATTAETKPKIKKPPRELMQLQEDIKEMFIRDEVLSATGIRMCRLAKLVDEKVPIAKEEPVLPEVGPVVVLEKFKDTIDKIAEPEKIKKKKAGPKAKVKFLIDTIPETVKIDKMPAPFKHKPGPKSKTKNKKDDDPYAFESDSVGDTITDKASNEGSSSNSDSENDSLASSNSFGSTEILADIKKKTKRKRRGWQAGVIKSKAKKKKVDVKQAESVPTNFEDLLPEKVMIPDLSCFTDRNYCFQKNQLTYSCRLCSFSGTDIVLHYRNQHPHVEIPLSRMTPEVAKEAIEQCEEINFKAISKIPSDKYVCTFCYKEFVNTKSVLETFFWHIVSMHTGEYKQNCSTCVNVNNCPFNLDIPPPPKDIKGQLIGYICKKCNFTQISLENLKTHVIIRHNDEQTAVYTINLSVMTKKSLNSLLRRSEVEQTALPISRDSIEKDSENEGVKTRTSTRIANQPATLPIQSKITFEGDDNSEISDMISETGEMNIKVERIDSENTDDIINNEDKPAIDQIEDPAADLNKNLAADLNENPAADLNRNPAADLNRNPAADLNRNPAADLNRNPAADLNRNPAADLNEIDRLASEGDQSTNQQNECPEQQTSNDIVDYPHFKVSVAESGAKEYFCCINGNYHFKTTLLISMKKHVQFKHSEKWDGYCHMCKVIVTPQGKHRFRDCLEHYLDIHMDSFPIFAKEVEPAPSEPAPSEPAPYEPTPSEVPVANSESPVANQLVSKPSVNVRRFSDLVNPNADVAVPLESASLPIIQSVVSLGAPTTTTEETGVSNETFRYEDHQAEVVSRKYYLVTQTMTVPDNLIKLFKCTGSYCSYATHSSEEALAHAATHQRFGGPDALDCCYCDFDSASNAVDLVTHVFKHHGNSQYCCQKCFYRAASSQAVASHLLRIHGVTASRANVLRASTASSVPQPQHKMLSREEAVAYYSCAHSDRDGACNFRTYTPDKFCEHLIQRHSTAIAHPCCFCATRAAIAADLVQHMKTHGLNLYQCTWCVHGSDDETDVLAHISMVHPDKQPQAYIRIITQKSLTTGLRVLPLAFLNKYKIQSKDIQVSETKENPVREAERSIKMKALIGTFRKYPPIAGTSERAKRAANTPEKNIESPKDTTPPKDNQISDQPTVQESVVKPPSATPLATPLPTVDVAQASLVKSEPVEIEKSAEPQVVVLDSEDEDTSTTQQPILNLAEEHFAAISNQSKPASHTLVTVDLYKCPKCRQVCKNMGGMKKHIYSCAKNTPYLQCPHCMCPVENIDRLLWHIVADHSEKNTFKCGLCGALLVTENFARKHFKTVHKDSNFVVTPNDKDGSARFLINARNKPETPKDRILPKRKLSGPKIDTTPIKRKFEPQEIDQLPINPILDHLVYCSRCEFSTKVRLNMVRHLQLHAEQQPVPQTAPVNPVPHLESNEKHFDKMVNLASSSIINRTPDKTRSEHTPAVTLLIPPEAATRYPKYVPERQRHTCGAKGCSYISVDEAMLRCHWETLHSGTSDFHCVHCPPHQHLDTSKPLTATRVISHLKMHDATLYACSSCSYYHFKKEALEKHLNEVHKGGRLMIVREEYSVPVPPGPVPTTTAPTMDLKPWQCGLCKFKSMLRPEVVDHCSKHHQSKMQFKCAYCPFRTSAIENISKHQMNSHAGKPEEIFYYYYREGSIPDEADGTPRWVRQHQKANSSEPEVKVEVSGSPVPTVVSSAPSPPITVDLNLVKKEVDEVQTTAVEETIDGLCKMFGQICEPNGIKFKCPLCKVIMDDTREGMQSHLYEELNYRKWSCGLCSYKAFHKAGLTDHMTSEHRRQYDHIELPTDLNIEKWVSSVLNYQSDIIAKLKENLAKQKIVVESKPGPSTEVVVAKEPPPTYTDKDLETAFGPPGSPNDLMFRCPKCGFVSKEELVMRDHLEMELNKIRWCCSNCPENFQTYHEAQFHCKGHDGPSRPVEAIRNPAMRAAWVSTAIKKQKTIIQNIPAQSHPEPPTSEKNIPDNDNSLLVVRYEERVPTPEQVNVKRKRPAPTVAPTLESDDEKLVIDEPCPKRKPDKKCPYCEYKSIYTNNVKIHMLTHFNLKPYSCGYCKFSCHKKSLTRHIQLMHANKPIKIRITELPPDARKIGEVDVPKLICLECEKAVPEEAIHTHLHANVRPQFTKSEIVVKCCVCLALCLDASCLQEHHRAVHPNDPVNYALYKLGYDSRETYQCAYCSNRFKYIKDYRAHHVAVHAELPFNITSTVYTPPVLNEGQRNVAGVVPQRRCARKSTTKLPNSVAKKSTTKLPYSVPSSTDDEEYSYYGTKPAPLQQYSSVTTLMSFCNKMMPFTIKQLSELLDIEPTVLVTDIKHSSD